MSSSPESISHIRRDLLSRPVRTYADNLNAELRTIWKELGIKTMAEFDRLAQERKIPEQVVRQYKDLITRLSEVVRSGKLPDDHPVVEHKEHTLDLNEVLKSSRDFYSSHNLQALANSLDSVILSLTKGERDRITFALEQGFTQALILPPQDLLQQNLDDILEECANKPADKLKEEDQYTPSYFNPVAKQVLTLNRPSSYLLLYSPGPIPEQTKNQAPKNLIDLFNSKHWNSLTIPEYLLLQRIEAEIRGNHDWGAYNDDSKKSNWTWLLDSRTSSVIANADWDPEDRRVGVYWVDPRDAFPELGARPTVVVPLE